MSLWKSLPDEFPADEEIVWVRRTYWFSSAYLATFSVAGQNFTDADGYIIPWYEVSRWKAQ